MTISTFATLVNERILVASAQTDYIAVERDHLVDFLKPTLRRIRVDEDWYLRQYPDIANAVAKGKISSGTEHYWRSGYFEHRMPYPIQVDEPWYLQQYEDVRTAVREKRFASATEHFYSTGYREGRLPFAGFAIEEV